MTMYADKWNFMQDAAHVYRRAIVYKVTAGFIREEEIRARCSENNYPFQSADANKRVSFCERKRIPGLFVKCLGRARNVVEIISKNFLPTACFNKRENLLVV